MEDLLCLHLMSLGLSALIQPRMFALFIFTIHPRQLTIHIFILNVLFILSDAWIMFSVFCCSHVTVFLPSFFVTPSLSISGRTLHAPHLCCVHFLSFTLKSLLSVLISLISSPCMLSSPLSYKSLTSICSLLILIFFLLCWVCLWLFAVCN